MTGNRPSIIYNGSPKNRNFHPDPMVSIVIDVKEGSICCSHLSIVHAVVYIQVQSYIICMHMPYIIHSTVE